MTGLCKARQYSDQMLCECGLAWDVNDPEPPKCRGTETGRFVFATGAKEALRTETDGRRYTTVDQPRQKRNKRVGTGYLRQMTRMLKK